MGAIAGYEYQFWNTVFAWINVHEGEVLFVEGAEDFDIVGADHSVAVQVRHTTEPTKITLGSAGVATALNEFWRLANSNPSRVTYRFLTRATAGSERGRPFSPSTGIECWQRCRGVGNDLRQIRAFLRNVDRLDESLRLLVRESSDQEFYDRLVSRVHWDTGNAATDLVERAVEDSLVLLGEKFGVLPEYASRVRHRLLREVVAAASRRTVSQLDRPDLLRIFQEDTAERVPRRAADSAHSFDPFVFPAGATTATISLESLIHTGPPLPEQFADRAELVAETAAILAEERIVALHGSSGMGKTSLANLVTRASGGRWHWVPLRGIETSQLQWILRGVRGLVHKAPGPTNLAIDDYPAETVELEEVLGALLFALLERGGSVVLTSYRPLSANLKSSLRLTGQSFIPVPPLSERDISEHLEKLGADSNKVSLWSPLLMAHTGGHPQLVHAAALGVSQRGFPTPSHNDLLDRPAGLSDVHERARRLLSGLADEPAKRLAYSLSPIHLSFRRDQAIAIAQEATNIEFPGEAFDQLVGPWIERMESTRYRVSPLLQGAAADVLGERQQEAHQHIANAIVRAGRMSQNEAAAVLFHAYLGRCDALLLRLAASVLNASQDVRVAVAHSATWLLAMRTDVPVYHDATVGYMLRALQYELAEAAEFSRTPAIGYAWEEQTRLEGDRSLLRVGMRLNCLARLCTSRTVDLAPADIVRWLCEIAVLKGQLSDADEGPPQPTQSAIPVFGVDVSSVFLAALNHIKDTDTLCKLVNALDGLDCETRRVILGPFLEEEYYANLLLRRVWLSEYQLETPDWTACLESFALVREAALSWGSEVLASAAIGSAAVVHLDNLEDPETSERLVREALEQLPGSRWLGAQLAVILSRVRRDEEALEVSSQFLGGWHPSQELPDTQPIFARQTAAVAASRVGDWHLSEEYFLAAARDAAALDLRHRELGYLSDSAFCAYKAGSFQEAVERFCEVIESLEGAEPLEDHPSLFRVSKLVGHILVWITLQPEEGDMVTPFAGMCSDFDFQEETLELGRTPFDVMWAVLSGFEEEQQLSTNIGSRMRSRLNASRSPVARSMFLTSELTRSFRRQEFGALPGLLVRYFAALLEHADAGGAQAWAVSESDESAAIARVLERPETCSWVKRSLLGALLQLASEGRLEDAPISVWVENATLIGAMDCLAEFLEDARSLFEAELESHARLLRDPGEDWFRRTLASVVVGTSEDARPDELFVAHALWFLTLAAERSSKPLGEEAVGEAAARSTSAAWLRAVEKPIFLELPAVSVPAIRSECQSDAAAWSKVARILLAARLGVRERLPDVMLERLQKAAIRGVDEEDLDATRAGNSSG